jgi:hypothetical protein
MRCPQCGTEFEKGSVEFCPNPNCGYPVSFLEEPQEDQPTPRMERKPGEAIPAPPPVPAPAPPPPPPPPQRPPRKLKVPVIALVAVVVVIAAVAAFLLLGHNKKSTPKPHATKSPHPKTSKTTQPPVAGELSWQTLVQPSFTGAGTGDQEIHALTGAQKIHGGAGIKFVAAGFDASAGDEDAAVWESQDGAQWIEVHDDALGGSGDQVINGITLSGGKILAGGSDGSDAALWSSADGQSWSEVSSPESSALGGVGDQVINRLRGTPAGILAVGYDSSSGAKDAAVWISKDGGHSWTRATDPTHALGGSGDQEIARVEVVTTGLGGVVAVGSDSSHGGDAAVWFSNDGQTWQRVPDPNGVLGGPGKQEMNDVQTFGTTLMAVGSDTKGGDADGAVWTSPNGVDWQRVPDPKNVFGGAGDQVFTRLVTPAQFDSTEIPNIMVGGFDTSGGDADAAIWFSNDGKAWARETRQKDIFGGSGDQKITSIAANAFPVIAVGFDASRGDEDAAAWVASGPAT